MNILLKSVKNTRYKQNLSVIQVLAKTNPASILAVDKTPIQKLVKRLLGAYALAMGPTCHTIKVRHRLAKGNAVLTLPNHSQPRLTSPRQSMPRRSSPNRPFGPCQTLPYPSPPNHSSANLTLPNRPFGPYQTIPYRDAPCLARPGPTQPWHAAPHSNLVIPNRPNVGRKSPRPISRPALSIVSRNACRSTYSGSITSK